MSSKLTIFSLNDERLNITSAMHVKSSKLAGCYDSISGSLMRDRFPGEIIPVTATQPHTKENDEVNNGAGLAIDLDYKTRNMAESTNPQHEHWLKISLDQTYCVQQVIRYESRGQVWQNWTLY